MKLQDSIEKMNLKDYFKIEKDGYTIVKGLFKKKINFILNLVRRT